MLSFWIGVMTTLSIEFLIILLIAANYGGKKK